MELTNLRPRELISGPFSFSHHYIFERRFIMGNDITKESLSMPAKVVGMTCELCGGIALEKFVRTAVNSMHESVEYGGVPTRIGEIFLRAGAFDFGSRIAGKVFFDCLDRKSVV